MRNLEEYAEYCMELLDEIHMDYVRPIAWKANSRTSRRWGCTTRKGYDKFEIEIASFLLDERNGDIALENTIIHELLHTCPGCFNHGEAWKNRALRVKRTLGYNISRLVTEEENKLVTVEPERKEEEYKYFFRCKQCGAICGKRKRMSGYAKHPETLVHSVCGGHVEIINRFGYEAMAAKEAR